MSKKKVTVEEEDKPPPPVLEEKDYFLNKLLRIDGKWWLPGQGNLQTQLMIIVSHPNKSDLESKKLLTTGDAGKELASALKDAGIPQELCYVTSMVKYGLGNKDKPSSEQIAECTPFLEAEIALIKPKLIIAMGAEVFKWVMKKNAKISSYMGEIVDCPYGKVLPNYSIGNIYAVDPKLRPLFKDIFYLGKRFVVGDLNYKKFEKIIVRDPKLNKMILQSYMDRGMWTVGYDMKWYGSYFKDETPYTFQYSCEDGKAVVLPLAKYDELTGQITVDWELLNSMKEFLEHPNVDRLGWNIRADDKRLVKYGIHPLDETLGFDGMKAIALFDSRWKKSLDVGIKRFTDYPPYYNKLTEALVKHKLKPHELSKLMFLDPETFFEYCAGDAVSHFTACNNMRKQLREDPKKAKVCKYYFDTYLPLSHYLLDMEATGIPIDLEVMGDITEKYTKCYNILADKLNRILKDSGFDTVKYEESVERIGEEATALLGLFEDFNPRSYLHKRALFFGKLRLTPAYYGRKGKTKPKAWYDKQKDHIKATYSPSTNGKSMASIRFQLAEQQHLEPDNKEIAHKYDIVKTYLDLARVSVFSNKFLAQKGTKFEAIFDADGDGEEEDDGSTDLEYLDVKDKAKAEAGGGGLKSSYWNALCTDGRIHADFYECLDNFRSSSKANVQNPASKVLSHIPQIFKDVGMEAEIPKNIRNIFYSGHPDYYLAEVDVAGADLAIAAALSRDPDYILDMRRGGFHTTKMREYFSDPNLGKDNASKYVTSKSITFRVAYTAGLMSAAMPIQAEIYAENGNLVELGLIEYALQTWTRYQTYMDYRDSCQQQVEEFQWIENERGMRFFFEETDNFSIKAGWMNQSLAYPIASELALFLWDVSVQLKNKFKRDGNWLKWIYPINTVHDASYWIVHKDMFKDSYFQEACKAYFTKEVKIVTGDNLGIEMVVADRWKGKEKIFSKETAWNFEASCWDWAK